MTSRDLLAGKRIVLGAATLTAGRGGIARVARMTARALTDLGAQITPVSYLDRAPLDVAGAAVACAGGDKLRFAALTCLKAIGREGFVYDSAGIARAHPSLIARGRGCVVWMHGIEVWENLRPDHHAVLRRARLVLVNSHYTLNRFQKLHGALPQARVCWLATEDDAAGEPASRSAGPLTVLALSRLDVGDVYKGHDALIAAWPRVLAAAPNARLVIAGDGGGRPALEARARALGLGDRIEFTGFVAEAALPALWARADVFAMPSRKEGFGLVYVEAMRQGVPVVASVHDAGGEVNVDGETGFNVDLGESEMLASRLIALLTDADLRRRCGDAGRRRWRAHFCYPRFLERIGALLGADEIQSPFSASQRADVRSSGRIPAQNR
ncbi:hypothetical protein CCR94_08320 [Rhodoblastus sphagnicola]|uniref:Glycosyl transferase family 1 domain-containing protein n=1 Tax=Rhodoblastus sphagnicola TaxID=333368 RepID=A0A2S6NAP1_9HYPH|nr:glycosyltransferase family 4 protein [Rhodoblastus sphagnicola]MBB4200282.1 phosphatidylinositol alpha-1,6-mannosyltransferase [Rhodoblastus sphagnicola]PPQ31667.1 hypothetical protein CCR94_08320 [Rhodoblastus sphagnicola]